MSNKAINDNQAQAFFLHPEIISAGWISKVTKLTKDTDCKATKEHIDVVYSALVLASGVAPIRDQLLDQSAQRLSQLIHTKVLASQYPETQTLFLDAMKLLETDPNHDIKMQAIAYLANSKRPDASSRNNNPSFQHP